MIVKYIGITILLLTIKGYTADTLLVFRSGDTARAGDVNANFKYLFDRFNALASENSVLKKSIDSIRAIKPIVVNTDSINSRFSNLSSQVVTMGLKIDSLKVIKPIVVNVDSINARINGLSVQLTGMNSKVDSNTTRLNTKIDSLTTKQSSANGLIIGISSKTDSLNIRASTIENRLVIFPKGSIIASMIEPGPDGYLPNSENTWLLAAGQGIINSVTVPDLRGVFIRGIDYIISGKGATGRDSTATRFAGSYQEDTMKSHNHGMNVSIGVYWGWRGGPGPSNESYVVDSPGETKLTNLPYGGEETRPKNIAIFYYIKVK
jgi:hypothetical protein